MVYSLGNKLILLEPVYPEYPFLIQDNGVMLISNPGGKFISSLSPTTASHFQQPTTC